ncbi:MAG: GNAT family N-acetyltransferase [Bacteroidetes bacterium]|nr:GNAT family N-acetyltransferase [Bacteroidota bacterium]
MEYTFKRLSPEYYKDLVYISKSAFGIDPGLEYYRLKNQTEVFGEPNLGFIAYDSAGEPAAFYGVYACPMIIDGKTLVAAQSGDTMTHKSHTGKGLFTTLAKMTYALAKEKGVKFIYGFPNYNSYPGFVKKLDWICPEKLVEFRTRQMTLPLVKIVKKVKVFSPLYSIYSKIILSLLTKQTGIFRASVLEGGIGSVDRTEQYGKYKQQSRSFFIELAGCKMWLKFDGFLMIGDIERKENFDYKKWWSKLQRLAFFLGADTILFQTMSSTFIHKKLSEFLPATEAFPTGYLILDPSVDPSKFKYVLGDVDTF